MIVYPSQAIAIPRHHIGTDGLVSASAHTATLFKNGVATAVTVTPTTSATGLYKFAFTIPADAAQGDVFTVEAVDADSYKAMIWEGVTDLRIDAILADTGTDGVVVAAGSKTGYTLTATTGLGNQTADITGTISTVTTLTNLPSITANWLTAAGLATDAVTEIVTAALTTQMTESYAADGVSPTLAQALFLIQQAITEFTIVVNTGAGTSTTTIKKIDGSTPAATLTLNSETAPTAATRAT